MSKLAALSWQGHGHVPRIKHAGPGEECSTSCAAVNPMTGRTPPTKTVTRARKKLRQQCCKEEQSTGSIVGCLITLGAQRCRVRQQVSEDVSPAACPSNDQEDLAVAAIHGDQVGWSHGL